jgi:hypothetical protein
LLHETSHWVAWAIALLIVEPIEGVLCALALAVIIAPDSPLAVFLSGAIRRATLSLILIVAALVVLIVGTLTYVAWYFAVEAN